ncbi:MAG: hypothetical protein HY586_06905 [Candidatus Omnitrophica bacterium]|nr:hypothetical protein [Candidatus Omnitrophota bacterium]
MKKIAALFVLLGLAVMPAAYADWNEEADYGDYFQKVPAMAGRGFVNAVTSPGYFIEDFTNGFKEQDWLGGAANGFVTGLGKSLAAGVGGVWDIATAILPEYRGAGYKRGMWPNYKWEIEEAAASTTTVVSES